MILANRVRRLSAAFATVAVLALAVPATAQEISESHLNAARAAVSAINATDQFDGILPQAAHALKSELIQKDPHLQSLIIATVDEKALALAGRRADLEKEAAMAYARVFSEKELNDIAAFYSTETGKKLLSDGPIVMREVIKAADIWQRGVGRDLAAAVAETLASVASENKQQQAAPTVQEPVTGNSQ